MKIKGDILCREFYKVYLFQGSLYLKFCNQWFISPVIWKDKEIQGKPSILCEFVPWIYLCLSKWQNLRKKKFLCCLYSHYEVEPYEIAIFNNQKLSNRLLTDPFSFTKEMANLRLTGKRSLVLALSWRLHNLIWSNQNITTLKSSAKIPMMHWTVIWIQYNQVSM